jgi:hypothetical protein
VFLRHRRAAVPALRGAAPHRRRVHRRAEATRSPGPARAQCTHRRQGIPMIGPERYAPSGLWSLGDGIDIPRRPQGPQAGGAAAWEDHRPRGGRRGSGSIRSDKVLEIAEPQGAGFWLTTRWEKGGKGWLRTRCEIRFARARAAPNNSYPPRAAIRRVRRRDPRRRSPYLPTAARSAGSRARPTWALTLALPVPTG